VRHNAIMVNGAGEHTVLRVPAGRRGRSRREGEEPLRIKGASEAATSRGFPEWLEVDSTTLKGKFKARPQRTELPSTINESLVVELYSK
jgi:small subunit ribosomal protein S4